jgi:hypothetical protein
MSVVNNVSDIAADLISGTFGPIGAAAASLAEQTFTDNTVEEMKANNEKYNDFLNYAPRTDAGKSANEGFLKTMGEGAEAVVDYYNKNEENIPDAVKNTVGAVADTWNDLDESTRFALGNLATVGEVLPMGKAASLAKKGINNATDARRISNAASEVPDESAYLPLQERLGAMGARQEMAAPSAVHKNGNPLGINVRESKDGTDFADLIVKGDKKYETRDTRSLDPYVGKSVGIVKTGKEKAALVGYATVGEPLEVDKEMFDALRSEHMVAEGSEFDIKEGGTKFLYPMSEVLSIEPNELPSKYKGIVARQIGESSNLKPTVAKNAEGKLVDINEFKGVTRLGADGNKLDTNMRATSYVATKEEIAATKKDRKDWKNTPEAKEKSTLNQEKIDAPTREEWRTRNKKANKQPRNLKLRDAAAKSMANEITPAEYQALVDKISPATIYTLEDISKKGFFPSTKEVEYALNLDKSMGIVGKDVRDISRDLNKDSVIIEDGTMVASRLDIPAYEQYDTWVVSLHDGSKSGGDSMAYGQTAVLKNVVFDTSTTGAAGISQGNAKNTIGRMYGEWLNQDPESVYAKAKELLADPDSDWVQVGYNPERHSFFYKKDGEIPLDSAEEVIQVGPLVMARGVKLNSIDDPKYTVQPSKMTKGTGQWNKGGLVEEMEAMGFAEGGLPDRTVPYGDSTNPSDQLGDIEFRADMDDWLRNNAVARLGYDPKRSKVVNDSRHIRRLAQYFLPPTDRQIPYQQEVLDGMQGSYANRNMADEDVQRLDLDNVVLTGNMADQPVWSHEYTHRGFSELRKYLKRDPKKFLRKYGQEAFDALNTITGRKLEESRVEAYDDHSIREPKETPTFIQMKDTVNWVEKAKAKGEIPDPDQIRYDKEKRDSVKKTLSSINTEEGMKAYEEDKYKTDNLQVQLHRAATDLLRERGEPIREDQKPSFMDDLSNSAKEAVLNLFN